jgi:methionyl-tRNA formyltransferase
MDERLSCVLLTSDQPHLADAAQAFARLLFDLRHVSRHGRGERQFPAAAEAVIADGGIDVLLNFLAPMIVPSRLLERVRGEAINFHPAPPAWPGIGAPSYALYHQDPEFGVTAHRMTRQRDAGEIVRVVRFSIVAGETCDSLYERAVHYSLPLF